MASRSDLSRKRVLVTGASGFTGRYMVDELRREGFHVVGTGSKIDSSTPEAGLAGCDEFHVMDLADRSQVEDVVQAVRPDYVVHLAAVAFVAHGDVEDFYRINILGTRHLLAALAELDAPPIKTLIASSANVYGNATQEAISESVAPFPANDYAVSKLSMEYVAALWQERIPLLVTRPFNYTGVGQARNFLIPKIVSHFQSRERVIELGNVDVWRDFGDVRMVANSYRRLLHSSEKSGTRVNVCTGVAHSLREVIEICSRITGHSIEIKVNPAFVRGNEVRILKGDNSLLRALIGPVEGPSLPETLEWMLAGG